ncbi:MAG: PAS domain S-box protein [Bacteroidales bacterium]|nr:PAS domain S-box protein [Bacteroidales bacterium]
MRILFLEDNLNDVYIIKRHIINELPHAQVIHLATKAEYESMLDSDFDMILSDYSMPEFNGMQALEMRNLKCPKKPFIIVTGSMNELTAVDCLKSGADNYILKEHLGRLIPAILKSMEDYQMLMAKMEAERELRIIYNRYQALIEHSGMAVLISEKDGVVTFANDFAKTLFGEKKLLINQSSIFQLLDVNSDYFDQESENGENYFDLKLTSSEGRVCYVNCYREVFYLDSVKSGYQYFIKDNTQQTRMKLVASAINRIARNALLNSDLKSFLSFSYNIIKEFIQTNNFFVALYNSADDTYSFPFYIDEKDDLDVFEGINIKGSLTDLVRRSGEAFFVNQESLQKLYEKKEISTFGTDCAVWIGVPLTHNDEVIGVIGVQNYNDEYGLTTDDLGLLERFAPWVSTKVYQEEMKKENALREKRFFDLFTSSPVAIVVHQDGIIKMANPAAIQLSGLESESQLVGNNVLSFVSDDFVDKVSERAKLVAQGFPQPTIVEKLKTYNNGFIYVEVTAIPFELDNKPANQVIMKDVTAEIKAREELLESEEKFRTAFKTSLDAITITEVETGNYVDVNEAFVRYTGFAEDEAIGQNSSSLNIWNDEVDRQKLISEIRDKGYVANFQTRFRMKSGKVEDALVSARFITFKNKSYLIMMSRVITDFVEASRQIEISEQKFNQIFNLASDPILLYRLTDQVVFHDFNQAFTDLYGYDIGELKNQSVYSIVADESLKMLPQHIESLRFDKTIRFETLHLKKSGEEVPVEVSARKIVIDDEDYILAIERDITERKHAETRLKYAREEYKRLSDLFRSLSDNVQAMIWAKDLNGNFIFTNKYFCDNLLIAKDVYEPLGKNDMFFANRQRQAKPDQPEWHTFGELCINSDEIVIQSKQTGRFEEFGNVKGKHLYLDVIKSPLFNESGELVATVGFGSDITEIKKAQNLLRDSEEKFRLSFSSSPDGLAIICFETMQAIEVNDRFTELTGYGSENWPEKFEFIPPFNNPDNVDYLIDRLMKDGSFRNLEYEITSATGTKFNALISANLLNVADKPHVMLVLTDITELKNIQQQLEVAIQRAEESDRLKSAFLANMSHEIRTPMNHIIGFTEFIKQGVSEEELHAYIDIIQKSSNHLLALINDIIDISKIEAGEVKMNITRLNPSSIVKELADSFAYDQRLLSKPNVRFVNNSRFSMLYHIKADRVRLMQVLINLITNAIKFTFDGSIEFGYDIQSDGFVRFYVRDTGIGISEESQKIVFERFRQATSQKYRNNEGTGLGLALSKAYVELMGGEIGLQSTVDKGSEFYFTIPLYQQKNKKAAQNADSFNGPNSIGLLLSDTTDEFLLMTFIKGISKDFNILKFNFGDSLSSIFNQEFLMIFISLGESVEESVRILKEIRARNEEWIIVGLLDYQRQVYDYQLQDTGFSAFIEKPLSKAKVASVFEKFLSEDGFIKES